MDKEKEMTETPTGGNATPTGGANEGTTGNPADAAPVESNPTDSSAVSDTQESSPETGVETVDNDSRVEDDQAVSEPQPTNADGSTVPTPDADESVDHEGTGAGEAPAGESDYEETQETQ
jgi:hypothetical protein